MAEVQEAVFPRNGGPVVLVSDGATTSRVSGSALVDEVVASLRPILERHGGGLPLELRLQVRAAVESTTE